MYNFVRKYIEVCDKVNKNTNVFLEIKDYLLPGEYRSNDLGNVIYRVGGNYCLGLYDTFDGVCKRNNPLSLMINHHTKKNIMINHSNDSFFKGEYVIISSSREEYKIFSEREECVLTKCLNIEKMKRIIRNRNLFSNYFNVPYVNKVDFESGIYIEKLIEHNETREEKALVNIFEKYVMFLKSQPGLKINDWKLVIDIFNCKFGTDIEYKLFGTLPKIFCHGDLWSSNIICYKNDYYIIDFENCGYRYFLYDFFMYIYMQLFLLEKAELMDNYFKGKYDKMFKQMFEAIGLNYDNNYRKTYFLGYLATLYNERWIKANSHSINKKIAETLRYYKLY